MLPALSRGHRLPIQIVKLPMKKLLSAIIRVMCALVIGVVVATPPPALAAGTAEDEISWSAAPANNSQGSGRPNFAYVLEPGSQIDDGFVITNYAASPQVFNVAAADAFLTETGALDVLKSDEESKDVGAWTSVAADEVTIGPGESVMVPFTIEVPAGASPGDHSGAIVSWIEDADPGDDGVSVVRRLGSRVQIRVTGDLEPSLQIDNSSMTYEGTQDPFGSASATVQFTVVNTGNTRLTGPSTITVAGPLGISPRQVEVELPELLPGSSFNVTQVVEDVRPLGLLIASIDVKPTVVPDDGDHPVDTAHASAVTWAIAWLPLAFVALLLAVMAYAVAGIVRRRRGAGRSAVPVEESESVV